MEPLVRTRRTNKVRICDMHGLDPRWLNLLDLDNVTKL